MIASAPRTPHERNPILYASEEGADYVTCRTCARCETYRVPCTCPRCGAGMTVSVGICTEWNEQTDMDEHRTGDDAECWEPM